MLSQLLFLGLVAFSSGQDVICKNQLFDKCHYPPEITAVHAETVEECAATCDLYATIDECDFYTYELSNVDENCKIYFGETLDVFRDGCDTIGGPLDQECVVYAETCNVDDMPPECNKQCTACGEQACSGFMKTTCNSVGGNNPMETQPDSPNDVFCRQFCDNLNAKLYIYHRESQLCECFANTEDDCRMWFITAGTDIAKCKPDAPLMVSNV